MGNKFTNYPLLLDSFIQLLLELNSTKQRELLIAPSMKTPLWEPDTVAIGKHEEKCEEETVDPDH